MCRSWPDRPSSGCLKDCRQRAIAPSRDIHAVACDRDAESVHHLASGPLATFDPAVQEALTKCRRVLPREVDWSLREFQEAPEVGVLAGAESGVGPTDPRVVHPRVEERKTVPRVRY